MSRVLAQLLVKFLCAFVLGAASVLGAMHISDFWYLWHQDLAAAISESQTLLLAKPGLALQSISRSFADSDEVAGGG